MTRETLADRYELGERIGRGGTATVFRAWDRWAERPVAVKWFAAGVAGPDRLRQEREWGTLSRLDHAGLVEMYDAGCEDDRAFLVMALIDGPTLHARLDEGPLAVDDVVALGRALAITLAYIHGRGITHRDVKPANVLLDATRGPLLADFGIALLVDATRVTTADAVIGTAAYMAPEQIRGEAVGPAADVYALGLVLLEALTAARAFPGTGPEAVIARLHRGPAVPEAVPAGLAAVIERMTAVVPTARPTAVEVAAVLENAIDGDPEVAAPPAPRRRGGTGAARAVLGQEAVPAASAGPRRPRPDTLLLSGAALLVAGAIATTVGLGGTDPPRATLPAASPPTVGAPVVPQDAPPTRGAADPSAGRPTAGAGGQPTAPHTTSAPGPLPEPVRTTTSPPSTEESPSGRGGPGRDSDGGGRGSDDSGGDQDGGGRGEDGGNGGDD